MLANMVARDKHSSLIQQSTYKHTSLLNSSMDKLQITGQNLGRVFNSKSGCMYPMHLCCCEAKLPSLKLKTWPNHLVGYLPLDIALTNSNKSFVVHAQTNQSTKISFQKLSYSSSFFLSPFMSSK